METGRWNNHVFTVSPQVIRGFTGLTIKGSSETEDKASGGQQRAARKAGKPAEVSLTVGLSALTGCQVREEALALVEDARAGASNYFYVGGKKLMTCQLMLTEADVDKVVIAHGGAWVSAEVRLTLRQCSGGDAASKKSGKGSAGNRRNIVTNVYIDPAAKTVKDTKKDAGAAVKSAVRSAEDNIKRLVENAKKLSKKNKKLKKKSGGVGAVFVKQ